MATAVTGALEMFFYVPTPKEATLSIHTLVYLVPYGALVRNLHFWAAQSLAATASVHMCRVIFTGAYAGPRRWNYLIGMSMLVLILFLDFTGYALRWDESVRWALVAGTNLIGSIPGIGPWLYRLVVGGSQPGGTTLLRFYAWHILGLNLALFGLIVWHIFRVRRDGGIAAPPSNVQPLSASDEAPGRERITRFELARREGIAALVVLAILLLMAVFLPAPIGAPIGEPGAPGGDPRAPWFFLWVQQLIKWGDPFLMGVLVPLGALALLAIIPFLPFAPRPAELGRWFPRRGRPVQILAALVILFILALTLLSLLDAPWAAAPSPGQPAPTPSRALPARQDPEQEAEPSRPSDDSLLIPEQPFVIFRSTCVF